jgi:hypothetical protein
MGLGSPVPDSHHGSRPQREHRLREVFNAGAAWRLLRAVLRLAQGRTAEPSAAIFDSRPVPSTSESGMRAGYDGAKRRRGSQVHMAVDTLGHLLAAHVTAANKQDWSQVSTLAAQVQEMTGDAVQREGGWIRKVR